MERVTYEKGEEPVKISMKLFFVGMNFIFFFPLSTYHVQDEELVKAFNKTAEVVTHIENKAFRKLSFGAFNEKALQAGVSEIDPHSRLLSPSEYDATKEKATALYGGIGVQVCEKEMDDEAVTVIDVFEGKSAHREGMKAGDKIIEVEGEPVRGSALEEIVGKIRGPLGTFVTLKVIRDKEPLTFKLKREKQTDESARSYLLPKHHIYYVIVRGFSEVASKQIEKTIEMLNSDKEANGLIIDFRNNLGGTVTSALDVLGLFLPKNSLVAITKDRNGNKINSYYTSRSPLLKKQIPIFVLTNTFSASASEICAGALRYYSSIASPGTSLSLVFIAGEESFGKGSVQEVIPLKTGGALKLTTMLYYLPSKDGKGLSIQAQGIEPDFKLCARYCDEKAQSWIEETYGKETSLRHHIPSPHAQTSSHKKKKKQKKHEKKDQNKKDLEASQEKNILSSYQIQQCVSMTSLLQLGRKVSPACMKHRDKALEFLKERVLDDSCSSIEKIEGH